MRPASSIAIPLLSTCISISKAAENCESVNEDGLCSNVFRKGCLREIAARRRSHRLVEQPNEEDLLETDNKFDVRVCNSDDLATAVAGSGKKYCRDPTFDYTEVRFAPGKVSFSCNIVQIPLMVLFASCSYTTSPLLQLRQAIGILPYS